MIPNPSTFTRWLAWLAWLGLAVTLRAEVRLLNVSFDISREFFDDYNRLFARHWQGKSGESVVINQSHGGSTKQARAVLDGLEADVVTFNQVTDIDRLAVGGLVGAGWRDRLPHRSSPFTSTIVFLVRRGNPKGIRDWDDLVRPGIQVVVPNPKTSGNGRYGFLAAYVHARRKAAATEHSATEFVTQLFRNVPVLDTGGRGATTTFVQREIGDVLLTFEAEAFLTARDLGSNRFEVVAPPISIEAELPVAVVDRVVRRHQTQSVAGEYLQHLYSEPAQALAAEHHFRPRSADALAKFPGRFAPITLVAVDEAFGSWAQAQKTHFAEGGTFDRIYR